MDNIESKQIEHMSSNTDVSFYFVFYCMDHNLKLNNSLVFSTLGKSKAILKQFGWKVDTCEVEMGNGVQRVFGLSRLLHEFTIGEYRGMDRW